ncbi:MAG: toxin-antitoxin system antidote component [Algoriphagus marincola HL-49]|uniref:Toxin-antitoxin system antidote component n=1 Tax=Algoriphagus marincola HL-49 TaxID=1305737 RepID=A0A0P7XT97_9BACT|nr:MAG: toxin-antitoxin system antidote component [Algoriphagus marincola HL-49]
MDIALEKIKLIEWLAGLEDVGVLKELIALKENSGQDWWENLSKEERKEIETGMNQADAGDLTKHKDVMSKYQ